MARRGRETGNDNNNSSNTMDFTLNLTVEARRTWFLGHDQQGIVHVGQRPHIIAERIRSAAAH